MAHRRTAPPRPPAVPPGNAEEGAARVSAAVVPIFDHKDGHGADWRLMTLSLFLAAFTMLDKLPEEDRRTIARRVHERSYSRTLPGPLDDDSGASKTPPVGADPGPANTAGIKSKGPRPPH